MSAADIPRRSHVASANTPGAASPPRSINAAFITELCPEVGAGMG